MNFLSSETAASEAIGHAILLGITVTGVSMILLYGVPAILSLEDMANIKNAEQTFTLLDSRASMAALGDSPLQITNINLGGGALAVKPNSSASTSYITVNSSSFNVTIPMGKIEYQFGDRIIAYEGGGVWSKYPSGSVMLSPPDFHYNGVTLTLPVTNISGNASVGGKGTAAVYFKKTATIVQYPNKSFANRTNPINYNTAGKVYVNITSDFYDAWYYYARTLPYTSVSKNPTTKTTSVEFTVAPVNLEKNSAVSDNIVFRGLGINPQPLRNFSFRIYDTDLSGLDWQMSAQSGTKTLIIQLRKNNNNLEIRVGYRDISFTGTNAETWRNDTAFPINITASPNYADIDLLKNFDITYDQRNVPRGGNTCSGLYIDQNFFNSSAFSWLPDKVINTTNDKQSLYNVTQHYFQLMMQDVPLNNCLENGNIDYTTSSMLINYTGNLSYLHITENRADAGIS